MLCIGGPKHGENVECMAPCFYALRSKPVLFSADSRYLPSDPIKTVKYECFWIKSDGEEIPVWVIR